MMNESENIMKGSVHKDDFFIVHDALVLMTLKETINCMRRKGYLYRWLIPRNGIQYGVPYSIRPVGNIHRLIPLHDLLNRDTMKCGI